MSPDKGECDTNHQDYQENRVSIFVSFAIIVWFTEDKSTTRLGISGQKKISQTSRSCVSSVLFILFRRIKDLLLGNVNESLFYLSNNPHSWVYTKRKYANISLPIFNATPLTWNVFIFELRRQSIKYELEIENIGTEHKSVYTTLWNSS